MRVVLLLLVSFCFLHAASTKSSSPIVINNTWSRADAQKEFYQFEFPTMYNKVIDDVTDLYLKGLGASSDSLYKRAIKVDTLTVGTTKASKNTVYSDSTKGPVIKAPDGKKWRIKVGNDGALTADSTGQN